MVARRRAWGGVAGAACDEIPRCDAQPRPQMATRRPSTAPAGSRRAWLCMRWPFRPTRGSRGSLRSHSFAVIRAQNGRSEVRDRVWTKQRTAFDLFSAARSGLAVVLRSRGARAVDSCRASGSKAAPRARRTASGACQNATRVPQHTPNAPRWQKVAWRGARGVDGLPRSATTPRSRAPRRSRRRRRPPRAGPRPRDREKEHTAGPRATHRTVK